jgi:hypothetical protein
MSDRSKRHLFQTRSGVGVARRRRQQGGLSETSNTFQDCQTLAPKKAFLASG